MTTIPHGVKQSVPVALATIAISVTFGVLAAPIMGPWSAVIMSLVVWSGGAQFAAVSVLSAGGSFMTAALTGIVANARYLPMGFAIAPAAKGSVSRRAVSAFPLTDASLVIARDDDGRFDLTRMAWAAPLQYLAWSGSTAVGAFAAPLIGDPERLGLDVLFPVFFLGLLLSELRRTKPATLTKPRNFYHWRSFTSALLAAILALALTPFTPAGIPVLAGAAVALIGLRLPHHEHLEGV